jgi:hypothetical protein
MGETQMNEETYREFIQWDISALELHMPEYSLEKRHIKEVLKWSIDQLYKNNEK